MSLAPVPQRWLDEIDREIERARGFLQQHDVVVPYFVLHSEDGATLQVFPPPQQHDKYDEIYATIRALGVYRQVHAISYVMEVTLVVQQMSAGESVDDVMERLKQTTIQHDNTEPSTGLVVGLCWRTDEGERQHTMCHMDIERQGVKFSGLNRKEFHRTQDKFASQAQDLLERRRPTNRQVANAHRFLNAMAIRDVHLHIIDRG